MVSRKASGARTAERAFDHGASERATIRGAGVNVLLRVDAGGRDLGGTRNRWLVDGAAIEHSFDLGQTAGAVADTDDSDMGVDHLAVSALVIEQRRGSHR